jgi:hypothetical protein
MPIKPTLVNRDAQKYAAIRVHIHREDLSDTVPALYSEVHEWLAINHIQMGAECFLHAES